MLRFTGLAQQTCDGCTRRDLLQAGGLSALGLLLPQVLHSSTAASPSAGFGRARACVIIYLFGGPSQLDTFDLKPDAPAEIRGEFRPIATNVPGLRLCEHLPRLARQADQFCLIRSMNHPHPRHGWGLYYMLTGRRHNRPHRAGPATADPGGGRLRPSDEGGQVVGRDVCDHGNRPPTPRGLRFVPGARREQKGNRRAAPLPKT